MKSDVEIIQELILQAAETPAATRNEQNPIKKGQVEGQIVLGRVK